MNTKERGERSVGAIIGRLIELGIPVLVPLGDCLRYDLVIQTNGVFQSVQCKTGHLFNDGAILKFKSASQNVLTAERRCYRGEVDLFAVYSPEIKKVYIIPVGEVGKTDGLLRLKPMKRETTKTKRWAKDFEL